MAANYHGKKFYNIGTRLGADGTKKMTKVEKQSLYMYFEKLDCCLKNVSISERVFGHKKCLLIKAKNL
jgi:hypothetical protein